jgi:hypothetical protein
MNEGEREKEDGKKEGMKRRKLERKFLLFLSLVQKRFQLNQSGTLSFSYSYPQDSLALMMDQKMFFECMNK